MTTSPTPAATPQPPPHGTPVEADPTTSSLAPTGSPAATSTADAKPSLGGRVAAVILATLGILFVVLLAQLLWRLYAQPGVTAQTLSSAVIDDSRTDVRIEVRAPAAATVSCESRARATDSLDVGSQTSTLGPTDSDRREIVVTVPTRRRAATAEVVSCRIVSPG